MEKDSLKKHERIFLPVDKEDAEFFVIKYDGEFKYNAEEKQGVIVFTPEELKQFLNQYNLSSIQNVDQFLKEKGLL